MNIARLQCLYTYTKVGLIDMPWSRYACSGGSLTGPNGHWSEWSLVRMLLLSALLTATGQISEKNFLKFYSDPAG